jgi:hypothetical protein
MRTFAERAIAKKGIRISRKSETALTVHQCTIRRAAEDWIVLYRGKMVGRAPLLADAEALAETAMLKRAIAVEQAKKRLAERKTAETEQAWDREHMLTDQPLAPGETW